MRSVIKMCCAASDVTKRTDDPPEIEPEHCTAGAVPLSLCYVTATLSSSKRPRILERNISVLPIVNM